MTIAPLERTDELDDAELAMSAARGDRLAFAAIYDRYADRLYDFSVGMLRDGDAAADCVQDVFVDAATQLGNLRDPSRLRSWLYAIARNHALARIRARRRELPSDELPEVVSPDPDMATLAARGELADLIAEACGGLSERDRTVFELTYRHGLDGGELAEALGVTHTNANTLVLRLRDGVERSLGALLLCRGVKADPAACLELAAIVDGWDGTFTVLVRKRAARHIDGCPTCDDERRRRVNPVALLGGVPVFLPAPALLREHTVTEASAALPDPTSDAPASSPTPGAARLSASQVRHARAALIAVFILIGIAGVAQLASPVRPDDYRVDPITELDDATSELPGDMSALFAPSSSVAPTATATPVEPSEPASGPTTTAITNSPTVTTEPTRAQTRAPTTTTRPNNSFTPSRPASSAMRTTASEPSTSTPTSASTVTSTSSSTVTSTSSTTTTTSDPIE